MQIFMKHGWKVGVNVLLSFSTTIIFSMNTPMNTSGTPVIANKVSCNLQQTITIFDPEKEVVNKKPWRKVVPGIVMITPDGKGVVVGEYGKVRHFLFDSKQDDKGKLIIEHPCAKEYIPMLAMTQQKDKSLLIVSAGNYTKADKKHVAEYIVYRNGWSKVEKFDRMIQAIAVDICGNKLIIGGQNSIVVVDLESNTMMKELFFDLKSCLMDIAVERLGHLMIGVGNQKMVQLMSLAEKDDKIGTGILTKLVSSDDIKKIYYPTREELLYLTEKGEAKTIGMYDLLNVDHSQEIKGADFSHPSLYDKVTADPGESVATAHWVSDPTSDHKIKIYRKYDNYIEKFVLEMPTIAEHYNCITEFGTRAQGLGRVLEVAIRGNRVVVLATDGKMRVFNLPEERPVYNQTEKTKSHEKLLDIKLTSLSKESVMSPRSGRKSRSASRDEHGKVIDQQDDLVGKRKTFLSSFKNFGHSSRESSPRRKDSREGSPIRDLSSVHNERKSLELNGLDLKACISALEEMEMGSLKHDNRSLQQSEKI